MHNNKILIIILTLFCIISIPYSLGLLKSNVNSSATLDTALWSVSVDSNSNRSLNLMPNAGAAQFTIVLTSNSEVDTEYSIIVSNIPSGVDVKLDNGNFESPASNSDTVTFSNVGTIIYDEGNNEKTHVLTFRANADAVIVSNQRVNIDVEFKQSI